MTDDRLFTTPEMMRVLGIRSRQTIYIWDAEPDQRGPGRSGLLLWSRRTIEELAAAHGRTCDWGKL